MGGVRVWPKLVVANDPYHSSNGRNFFVAFFFLFWRKELERRPLSCWPVVLMASGSSSVASTASTVSSRKLGTPAKGVALAKKRRAAAAAKSTRVKIMCTYNGPSNQHLLLFYFCEYQCTS